MSNNNKMIDDDEEMNSSLLRGESSRKTEDDTRQMPFCGCISVQYYQPYFDLDTQDVINRIWNSLFFCRRQETFLDSIIQKPDAYGPFWVLIISLLFFYSYNFFIYL